MGDPICDLGGLWPVRWDLAMALDAANALACRGYLDPDDDTVPDEIAAELAELARKGPCEECPGWPSPDTLADHYLAKIRDGWERGLPVWTCGCGTVYKRLTEGGYSLLGALGGEETFYQTRGDGLLGDQAGLIRRDTRGRVKHSDACPGCGRSFAETITRQTRQPGSWAAPKPAGQQPAEYADALF